MKRFSPLQQRARHHGIQTSYIDSAGLEQFASDETLRILLARLGADEEYDRDVIADPVLVQWQESRAPLKTRLREKPLNIELLHEDGERIPLRKFEVRELGKNGFEVQLPVPSLPTGYRHLVYDTRSGEQRSLLITAPTTLYADERRQWGAFLPLYAAHSSKSWGAGNLSDWKELTHWVRGAGGTVVGSLPIMAAFLDYPKCEPSPYSPASRLFWNEFFIDITAIPEFSRSAAATKLTGSAAFQKKLQRFRASDLIDYQEEWGVRRRVLEILASEFFRRRSERRIKFDRYLRERPEAADYARFRAARDRAKSSWHLWKAKARGGNLRPADYEKSTEQFYLYAQWIVQEQIDRVLASCRGEGMKFYLDLPLGVNPDGFDAWRYRDFFAREVSTGAPPDAFFTKGQDWGFAPLDPQRARQLGYRYVIDYLRFQMRHTGLLRIDHVMGLHRLWWVPHGHPASAGGYVRYPAHELYAILSVESHRHQTMLVGENLGTVPPEVNKSMDKHGLRRMYVLQYEEPAKGPLPLPEAHVVASVNTHDMPMFAAHWKGLDILDRADLGLIASKDLPREEKERDALRKNLLSFLRKEKFLRKNANGASEILTALLQFLARSRAETVLINLEDLWGEERSQNVPGTSSERPNWRRKSALSLEQIISSGEVAETLKKVFSSGTR